MPPKPSRIEWKSGEQLEFLLSQESSFRRCQDMKTLNHFWPRVFENWYDRWPIVSTPALSKKYGTPEAARIMVQKETNAVRLIFSYLATIVLTPSVYSKSKTGSAPAPVVGRSRRRFEVI